MGKPKVAEDEATSLDVPSVASNDIKAALKTEIERLDAFFGEVIDLIPPEHYGFSAETLELLRNRKHAVLGKKLKKGEKTMKPSKKHTLSTADDDQLRSVSQIQKWMVEQSEDTDNPDDPRPAKAKRLSNKGSKKVLTAAPLSRQELIQKLHEKLESLKKTRRGKKVNAVDHREATRVKRRISKIKMKERKRKERLELNRGTPSAKDEEEELANQGSSLDKTTTKRSHSVASSNDGSPKKKTVKKSKLEQLREKTKHPAGDDKKKKGILTPEGKVVYSKFDFAISGTPEEKKQKKRKGKLSGKDYKRLLERVERQEDKVKTKMATDPVGAREFQKKIQWEAAIQRAQGVKVKDNPELLKLSLKKKQQRKEQSRKKWEKRDESVKVQQKQRDDKRKQNLKKRQDSKKQKGIERAKKKGRYVPGF